jgi:hypothetical protein
MNKSKPDAGGPLSTILSVVIFVAVAVFFVKFVSRVFTPSTAQPAASASSVESATPTSTPVPTPTATPEPTASPDQADADRVGYPLDQYLNMKQTMLDCGFDETTIRLVKAIGTNEAYCNWGKSVVKIRFDADYKVCRIYAGDTDIYNDGAVVGDVNDILVSSMQYVTLCNSAQSDASNYLKSPSTAVYPDVLGDDWTVVRDSDYFYVKSYVDSQNGFGATLRTNFICRYTWDGVDYTFPTLVDVTFDD